MRVTDARKGMIVVHEGQLHVIVDYEHIAPGNWRAINQLKLKNLKTGSNVMLRLGSSDSLEQAFLDLKPATYLYFDRNAGYVFMDSRELRAAHDPGGADRRQKGLPDRELRGHPDLSRRPARRTSSCRRP